MSRPHVAIWPKRHQSACELVASAAGSNICTLTINMYRIKIFKRLTIASDTYISNTSVTTSSPSRHRLVTLSLQTSASASALASARVTAPASLSPNFPFDLLIP